jgi:hypothetical protein
VGRLLIAISSGLALLPHDALSQTAAKVYRIGVLQTTPADLRSPTSLAFIDELCLRGYVEGRNLVFERRDAAGRVDSCARLPESWSRFTPT